MTDRMSPDQRSALMSRIRRKDTGPEVAVRRLAHALGCRFRLHRRDLPGTPDLVFPRLRKVLFVHGCFWHSHQNPGCRNGVLPKTRREWWQTKLSANVARDARNMELLSAEGWEVLVLWECEIRSGAFESKLADFLGASDRLATSQHVAVSGPPPPHGRSR
jgi:DNA mismatch endonuclease (patch repair protein)